MAAVHIGHSLHREAATNRYEDGTSERDVLLAVFEELRTIQVAVVIVSIVAVPLMLLGNAELLASGSRSS